VGRGEARVGAASVKVSGASIVRFHARTIGMSCFGLISGV